MYGDEGGLIEFRSSLLATRGFAALSLPYFDFEDLPKVMKELKLEYFEEAARFLQRHPKVSAWEITAEDKGACGSHTYVVVMFLRGY